MKSMHPFVYAALANLFWAGNAVVGKAMADHIPAMTLSFWRWCFASLILMPFAWKGFVKHRAWFRTNWLLTCVLAILSITMFNSLQYLSLHYTSPTNVGIVGAMMPLFITVLSVLFFSQPISTLQVLGIFIGLSGVTLVITGGNLSQINLNPGDLIMVTAVFGFSIYSILLRRIPAHIETSALLLVLMVVGTLFILPVYLVVDVAQGHTWNPTATSSLATLAYVALFPAISSYYCWNFAVKRGGPILTGLSLNLSPVFAMILAWVFLGNPILPIHVIATGLVFAGIYLALKFRPKND